MEKHITVDTHEMAEEMKHVSRTVAGTTAAVGAMHTAVIAEEASSAQRICANLNNGFYYSVVAQIEQKYAREKSQSDALAIELIQYQKELASLKVRMGKDYNAFTVRYTRLFDTLNNELKNRVYELDRPVMEFCREKIKLMQQRICNLISTVPVNQSESLTATQMIAAAHIKENAKELIESIKDYIKNDKKVEEDAGSIRQPEGVQKEECHYLPFILMEDDNTKQLHLFGNNLSQTITESLTGQDRQWEWKEVDETTRKKVADNYNAFVQNANLPQRVKEEMLRLFNKHLKWQSLKED